MRIRRYEARSLKEAFSLVRADLGPEAVIISTKKVRGGVEVSAAVDYDAPLAHRPAAPAAGPAPQGVGPTEAALRDLRLDVAALRQAVLGASLLEGSPGRAALYGYLAGRGLSGEVALEVMAALGEGEAALPPEGEALAELSRALEGMVEVGGFQAAKGGRRTLAALVGPTGVGKTTMLAKLAARLAVRDRLKVAIVSCDSYRVGAPDQIRTFARILDVPLAFAHSERELPEALAGQGGRDVVLIDTAGRSPHDAERLAEVAGLAEAGVEVHLVLAATTRDEELAAAIRSFAPTGFRSVMFTKLDEAERLGAMVNAARRAGRPISWLGTGQRVPGDLEAATPAGVARFVLHTSGSGRDDKAWGRQQGA